MTASIVDQQVRRFLETAEPEALCISGAWGVGKTFMWNHVLRAARDGGKIALKNYSYVSLFGVNSIEEIKYAIFENKIPIEEIGSKATIAALKRNARAYSKVIKDALSSLPWIGNSLSAAAPLVLLTIAEQIICIDDLERKGGDLEVRDVLGLVTFLKEQRNCKVAILSNTSTLTGKDKEQYDAYLEKAVDEFLVFEPTAQYAADIALADDNTGLAEKSVALGISNIRVLKRIQRLVRNAKAALSSYGPPVHQQVVHSLALFGWMKFSTGVAPPFAVLERRSSHRMLDAIGEADKANPEFAAWNALIDSYGFTDLDDLDRALLQGVENGYFNEVELQKAADSLTSSVEVQQARDTQRAAWRLFHDSFADNEAEVADAIFQAIHDNVAQVEMINLYGAMMLLRDLGRNTQSVQLMQRYIELYNGDRRAFDLEHGTMFSDRITDPAFIAAFKKQYAACADDRDPVQVIIQLAEHGGSNEDYARAATISVDEIMRELQTRNGVELHKFIDACLESDRISNTGEPQRQISTRMKEVLERIGQTSRLNALRVKKYDVGPHAKGKQKPSSED